LNPGDEKISKEIGLVLHSTDFSGAGEQIQYSLTIDAVNGDVKISSSTFHK
jgi:hypothetical protein